jgi:hypothetical protein
MVEAVRAIRNLGTGFEVLFDNEQKLIDSGSPVLQEDPNAPKEYHGGRFEPWAQIEGSLPQRSEGNI